MTSIDDLYNQVARDYGRKSYRTADEDSFREFMKKKTIFMYDEHFKQAWSEFEKPYLEDDYHEMETFLWNPPGFPWDPGGGWDFPTIPTDPQDPGNPFGWPSLTVFWCQVSGCFCENDTREATINCSHPITAIGLASPTARLAARDFSLSADIGGTSARLSITAGEDPPGALEIDIKMRSAGGVAGSHDSIMISSCSDCDLCDEETVAVEWDAENSPTTIDVGQTLQVFILNGIPPFTWTVEVCGNDLTKCAVINAVTMSRSNQVKAKTGACGAMRIKVVDACEAEAIGTLKITTGIWKGCDSNNYYSAGGCTCSCSHTYHAYYWGDLCTGLGPTGAYYDKACLYLSDVERNVSLCNGACCGPGCAPETCLIGPKTCAWAPGLSVACWSPCSTGNHLRTTDWLSGELWACA